MRSKVKFELKENNLEAYSEVEELIAFYTKKFCLQSWTITPLFVSAARMKQEMGEESYLGGNFCDWQYHACTIFINVEHPDINEQLEATIVHELLHLVTTEFERLALLMADRMRDKDYFKAECKVMLERLVVNLEQIVLAMKEASQ
jgi:hypothetical protein